MRNCFPGYYQPTSDEFKSLWENCIFIFDANVLLNLYRYSAETRDELLSILEEISDRIWIPHQAALEYQENRLSVIQHQIDAYEQLQNTLETFKNKIENELNSLTGKGRHPFMNSEDFMSKIVTAFVEILEEIRDLQQQHPNLLEDDPLRERVTELFEGKVGRPYSDENLSQIYREGKTRFENKIPPGYKDQEKGLLFQYSDLILWYQVIDFAKDEKKPIILVTDDRKEDWWLKIKGKTIGPQPKLIGEMALKTSMPFYMYSTDPFMVKAREYLNQQIDQQAIDEVQSIREQDESNLRNIIEAINLVNDSDLVRLGSSMDTPEAIKQALQPSKAMDDLMAQMRAATQGSRAIDELMAQMRATTQRSTMVDELMAQVRATTQRSAMVDELMAQVRATMQGSNVIGKLLAQMSADWPLARLDSSNVIKPTRTTNDTPPDAEDGVADNDKNDG